MSEIVEFPGAPLADEVTVLAESGTVTDVYQLLGDQFVDITVRAGYDQGAGFVVCAGPLRLTPLEALQLAHALIAGYNALAAAEVV